MMHDEPKRDTSMAFTQDVVAAYDALQTAYPQEQNSAWQGMQRWHSRPCGRINLHEALSNCRLCTVVTSAGQHCELP